MSLFAGSHMEPTMKSSFKLPQVRSDGIIELTREYATLKLKAPTLDVAATVRTEFPPYEEQKKAQTQEAAIAMREPRIRSSSVQADIRNFDILPLVKTLPDDVLSGGPPTGLEPARMQVPSTLLYLSHLTLQYKSIVF